MNSVMIDAEFYAGNRLESFVLQAEEKLEIKNKIYTTRVFYNHEDAYRYLQTYHNEIKACFIKIATRRELEILKKMQNLKTQAFFMIYTDNPELNSELLAFTISQLWTHMTIKSEHDDEIKKMIEKVLAYTFTNNLKTVEISGYPVAVDSILYIVSDKIHRNYLKAVTKDNECLIRGTIAEVKNKIPDLISLGRGLLVNPKKIRHIEADGLTLSFEQSLVKIKAPASCKKELRSLKSHDK
ncbi:LytTR family DNA-binding domain-containing protein [Lactococcus allomyrinae]|uniref:LytTR family transcriptional regulator n=1 Tax=Lactococcus allomyrinae TaxID=2419773 RepID=A0A387BGV6_9LACT|nr:LytTR family DNA-binding domain-containing protein [Lactococcus allomyrinae]AYG00619.1 LytTR family transcriptional regulator [Lactococcus allomyrinae]